MHLDSDVVRVVCPPVSAGSAVAPPKAGEQNAGLSCVEVREDQSQGQRMPVQPLLQLAEHALLSSGSGRRIGL